MKTKEDIDILINREISRAGFDVKLLEIINYVFSTGGKRLRPLMFLETYSFNRFIVFCGSFAITAPAYTAPHIR